MRGSCQSRADPPQPGAGGGWGCPCGTCNGSLAAAFGSHNAFVCAAVKLNHFSVFQETMYFQSDFILIFKFRCLKFVKTVSALLSAGRMLLILQLLIVKHSFGYTAIKNTINEACETVSMAGVNHFDVLAK